jgi:hypothetical protein
MPWRVGDRVEGSNAVSACLGSRRVVLSSESRRRELALGVDRVGSLVFSATQRGLSGPRAFRNCYRRLCGGFFHFLRNTRRRRSAHGHTLAKALR